MIPAAKQFLDTNILVYAFAADPKTAAAEALLAKGCAIGVQGLNEFANVARRKLGMSWEETEEALAAIRELSSAIHPSTLATHERAVAIARRHSIAIFDAVMLATALEAACETFWSEDLHDGMVLDGSMTIANPFSR